MKLTMLFLSALFSTQLWAQAAQFKGYVEIQRELGERMLSTGSLPFSRYFQNMKAADVIGLLRLMGATPTGIGESTFQNGEPNAINMLMWDLVVHGVSEDLKNACVASSGDLHFNADFMQALTATCAWPAASAQNPTVMENFWLALVSYDAPEEEFEAWRDFFLHSSFAHRPAAETIPAMVTAALLNPNFLLRQ